MPIDAAQLQTMTPDELDELFKRAPPARSPTARPTAPSSGVRHRPDRAGRGAHPPGRLEGKVFDRGKGELLNKISPLGIEAVRAKVYKEASWFDEKETIVLDYSDTSSSRSGSGTRSARSRPASTSASSSGSGPSSSTSRSTSTPDSVPFQSALSVVAPVRDGAADELEAVAGRDGERGRQRRGDRLRALRGPLRADRRRARRHRPPRTAAAGDRRLPRRPRRVPGGTWPSSRAAPARA